MVLRWTKGSSNAGYLARDIQEPSVEESIIEHMGPGPWHTYAKDSLTNTHFSSSGQNASQALNEDVLIFCYNPDPGRKLYVG